MVRRHSCCALSLHQPAEEEPCARAKRSSDAASEGSNHSITRSARSNTDRGIVMPMAFAVFRLMTISNFVGKTRSSTGRRSRASGGTPVQPDLKVRHGLAPQRAKGRVVGSLIATGQRAAVAAVLLSTRGMPKAAQGRARPSDELNGLDPVLSIDCPRGLASRVHRLLTQQPPRRSTQGMALA